jgi:Spy/CpxP family protein refolding chaperone
MNNVHKMSLALLVAAMMAPSIASAQGPSDGPPGGGPQGGFPGGGFQGGPQGRGFGGPGGGFQSGGPMRGMQGGPLIGMKVSAVSTPMETLDSVLSLSPTQRTQIAAIQSEFRDRIRNLGPRPDLTGGFGPGAGGPPQLNASDREKADDLASTMSKRIEAVLSSSQSQSLSVLLAQLKELQAAQIPPQLFSRLNLTDTQYDRIAKIESSAKQEIKTAVDKAASSEDYDQLEIALQDSHREIADRVRSVLTPEQRASVRGPGQIRGMGAFGRRPGGGGQGGGFGGPGGGPAASPGGFGGVNDPGGFGPGPDGGQDGPPPMDDGQGGPPPPGGDPQDDGPGPGGF